MSLYVFFRGTARALNAGLLTPRLLDGLAAAVASGVSGFVTRPMQGHRLVEEVISPYDKIGVLTAIGSLVKRAIDHYMPISPIAVEHMLAAASVVAPDLAHRGLANWEKGTEVLLNTINDKSERQQQLIRDVKLAHKVLYAEDIAPTDKLGLAREIGDRTWRAVALAGLVLNPFGRAAFERQRLAEQLIIVDTLIHGAAHAGQYSSQLQEAMVSLLPQFCTHPHIEAQIPVIAKAVEQLRTSYAHRLARELRNRGATEMVAKLAKQVKRRPITEMLYSGANITPPVTHYIRFLDALQPKHEGTPYLYAPLVAAALGAYLKEIRSFRRQEELDGVVRHLSAQVNRPGMEEALCGCVLATVPLINETKDPIVAYSAPLRELVVRCGLQEKAAQSLLNIYDPVHKSQGFAFEGLGAESMGYHRQAGY